MDNNKKYSLGLQNIKDEEIRCAKLLEFADISLSKQINDVIGTVLVVTLKTN